MKKFCENYKRLFGSNPKNVLEIGSRDGDDANIIKEYFNIPDDKVYIVEPNPPQAKKIRIKYPNFKVFEVAISQFTGLSKFNSVNSNDDGAVGMSSLLRRKGENPYFNEKLLSSYDNWIQVLSISGKILLDLIGDPEYDLVKIDVEGATYLVIKSFGDDIKKIKYIHMEAETFEYWKGEMTYDTIYKYMESMGFKELYKIDTYPGQCDTVWYNEKFKTNDIENIDEGRLKIGINFYAKDDVNNQIWSNGIFQNAYYLAKTLTNTKHDIYLVNTSQTSPKNDSEENIKTISYNDIKGELDLLILLGCDINEEDLEFHKKRGCKVIYYNCGNEYLFNMENNIFKKETNPKKFKQLDEIWMIPQMMPQNEFYNTVLNKTKVKEIKFVWDSFFVDKIIEKIEKRKIYEPIEGPKRISIFEPNINTMKYCLYPILISEAAYRENSKLIDKVWVTNADKIRNNVEFSTTIENLDLQFDGRISFESRFILPSFLSSHVDVVVSHQWENALNYMYFDVVYLGYPLVHNAYLCKDLGYYYPEFDGEEGKNQLLKALTEHDKNYEEYRIKHRELLYKYSPNNPENVKFYDDLINELFEKKLTIKNTNKVTFVLTSCGRVDLLEKTLTSFFKYNTYPIEKYILIDDSADEKVFEDIKKLNQKFGNIFDLHFNHEKLGQTKSIDKVYSMVDTDYIFHCEDDWEFYDSDFIEKSIEILEEDNKILQVWIRPKKDNIVSNISDQIIQTKNGTKYRKVLKTSFKYYQDGIENVVHDYNGFSFNPGLRRIVDYKSIISYFNFGGEHLIDSFYKDLNYYVVSLSEFNDEGYVRHIGWERRVKNTIF